MVATKAALSIRVDALTDADGKSEESASSIGVANRSKLETRLRDLEHQAEFGTVRRMGGDNKRQSKFEMTGATKTYNTGADVVMGDAEEFAPTQREAAAVEKAVKAVLDVKEERKKEKEAKRAKKAEKEKAKPKVSDDESESPAPSPKKEKKSKEEKKRKRRESAVEGMEVDEPAAKEETEEEKKARKKAEKAAKKAAAAEADAPKKKKKRTESP
jgi:nucleolar protein 58